tara:strand:- start:761 stop:1492 length:732 start_codon:yes stop_codon:yes gene_type:complete
MSARPPRGAPPGLKTGNPPSGPPPSGPPGLSSGPPDIKAARPPPGGPPGLGETKSSGPPAIRAVATKKSANKKQSEAPTRKGSLSSTQKEEIKECFAMFDRDNDGYIELKEVGVLMMSLGMSPTREELQSVMKKIRPSKKGHVSLPEFLEIAKSDSRKVSSGDEILEGFKIYDQMMSRDRNTGKISVKELRQVMTTFGEKLNGDEVDGMVKFADDCTFNGDIDYTRFVDKMMNPNKHRKNPAV